MSLPVLVMIPKGPGYVGVAFIANIHMDYECVTYSLNYDIPFVQVIDV